MFHVKQFMSGRYIVKLSFSDFNWFGRYLDYEGTRYFDYSASGFEFSFCGTKAWCKILSDPELFEEDSKGILGVFITDIESGNTELKKMVLSQKENHLVLFESDKSQKVSIKVMRFSEAYYGYSGLTDIEIDGELIELPKEEKKLKLEFIGDSITCGYGIDGFLGKDGFKTEQERPDLTYAYLAAGNLNADAHLICRSGTGLISCAVASDDAKEPDLQEPLMNQLWPYTDRFLSERLGIEPEVWDESRFSPDVVIINLGTNDESWVNGRRDRKASFVNLYEQLLEAVHRRSAKAAILGCLGVCGQQMCDPVMEAIEHFSKNFPKVKTKFLMFPLQQKVDGIGANWHPSAKTHKIMSDFLTEDIKALLQ